MSLKALFARRRCRRAGKAIYRRRGVRAAAGGGAGVGAERLALPAGFRSGRFAAAVADHLRGRLLLGQRDLPDLPESAARHPEPVHRPRAVHPEPRALCAVAGLRHPAFGGVAGADARPQGAVAGDGWRACCCRASCCGRTRYDEEQLRIVGGAEQNGHDYGWQFGNWGLEASRASRKTSGTGIPTEEDFAREWGALTTALARPSRTIRRR